MVCLADSRIIITDRKIFYDKKDKFYYLEIFYSRGKSDIYGPFKTYKEAESFL